MAECLLCGVHLSVVTGREPYKDGEACEDCYYNALSDLLEAAPIGNPRRRGEER